MIIDTHSGSRQLDRSKFALLKTIPDSAMRQGARLFMHNFISSIPPDDIDPLQVDPDKVKYYLNFQPNKAEYDLLIKTQTSLGRHELYESGSLESSARNIAFQVV